MTHAVITESRNYPGCPTDHRSCPVKYFNHVDVLITNILLSITFHHIKLKTGGMK